ncbi:MAG: LysM peptidoglycan-binding domain-containing protein [Firmicutes bacterium]|nr:LysM peptidoglycan-binding domain-containing protein [Bacillota bacterium]
MKSQIRVEGRIELKTPAKRILETSARCFMTEVERTEAEVTMRGTVTTRVIFIDETDMYNSEERTDSFTEKVNLQNHETITSVAPMVHVMETRHNDAGGGMVDVINVIELVMMGLVTREVRFVADLRGDVECRRETVALPSFGAQMTSRFEIEETIDLDKDCDGVLGTDIVAGLRDVIIGDGKVVLKGVMSANVISVRAGGVHAEVREFDFSKTLTHRDLGIDDKMTGRITVGAVTMRTDNRERPQLTVVAELIFVGYTVTTETAESITDAFSYTNALDFVRGTAQTTSVLPQHNSVLEVEGNLTMPANAPFITRICSVSGARVSGTNIVVATDRATVEGMITAQIVYECEERGIHIHTVNVPFSVATRVDGLTTAHNVALSVTVLACRVKARRGREIMVDARVAISLSGVSNVETAVVTDITLGAEIPRDTSAILIYTVLDGETLWDVAKRIAVPTAEITGQNPEMGENLKSGDKIFIYRQHVINF